jgi:hypothetical protein
VVLKTHAESQARLAQQNAARVSDQRAQPNALEPASTPDTDSGAESTSRAALAKNGTENSAVSRKESAAALAPAETKPAVPKSVANTAVSSAASQSTLHSGEVPVPASSGLNASSAPTANASANTNSATNARKATRADLLDSEVALLDATRTALKQGDANAALALLDRHAQLSTRTLSAEALLLRVQALVLAGRSAEARALARFALNGKSALPYAARLRKLAGLDE